jgi:MazG family protein
MPRPFDPCVPPPLEQQTGNTFPRLVELMQRLLAEDGCPWDREQTFESLRRYVIEEACEVVDAIDHGDRTDLCAELGDLLLQVVFQAELGRKEGAFGPDDVVAAICDKLVRRHPHVFEDVVVDGAAEVLSNWELIKAKERSKDGKKRGLLDGVPRSLPGLMRAQRIGEKVARVGFDWADRRGSRAKISEELAELDQAIEGGDAEKVEEELGDLLFATMNLARHLHIDGESAIRRTIDKFTARFAHVERRVEEVHGGFPSYQDKEKLPLEELDRYWEEAKRLGRTDPPDPPGLR